MSGEVKLGEADYTVFWERLLFMSNILCQISWKRPFDAYSLVSNILAIMNKSGTYIDYQV